VGGSFREIGKTVPPLLISAGATILNCIFNWILIYGNLGAPALGVNGAALATIIARVAEALAYLVYAHVSKAPFYVKFTRLFHLRLSLIKEILGRSAMMFLSDSSWIVTETVMTALYNGRGGAETVAGMAAGLAIANLTFLVWSGLFTVSNVLIGGSLGAGKLEEAKKRARWIESGATLAGFVVALVVMALSQLLVPIVFGNLSSEARSICFGIIYVVLIYMPFWALLNSVWAITRAGGDTFTGMVADVTVNIFLFLPACFLLAFFTSIGPWQLYAIVKLTDIVKYAIARHLMNKERWVRNVTV
jgi:Na+-driven multidrug efflux pump